MKVGESARVQAEHIDLEGRSVSRLANLEVSCEGLFSGELATVQIVALSKHHPRAFAQLSVLHEKHPARRQAPCPNHSANRGQCTGCALMELSEAGQRQEKRLMLERAFGLRVTHVESAPQDLGYRYSSKRVALSFEGQLTLGSYTRGTHRPAAMPGCLVDHPRLVHAFAEVERSARSHAIQPYDEASQSGDLRYVWGKTNGEHVIVTLVVATQVSRALSLIPAELRDVQGVLFSVQTSEGNALRGNGAEPLVGLRELNVRLLDQRVEVGALGFLQPNPLVAEAAYRALLGDPPAASHDALAFDLYAGAGITTEALRTRYREVVACEAFAESAARLGVEPLTVETFLERELSREQRRTPDLIIANPPRKGLGLAVTRALNQLAASELRIMSCGPQGLARDLAALTDGSGGYELVQLRAFDTLPQTPHIELVATLRRRC